MNDLARRGRTIVYVVVLVAVAFFVHLVTASLTIDGNAAVPISPGVMVPLDVTFTNGYDFPVSITNLRMTVRDVQAPNASSTHHCTVDDFVVDQVPRTFKIPVGARAARSLSSLHVAAATWPHVHLHRLSTNRNACQGASLTFGYTASRTLKIL